MGFCFILSDSSLIIYVLLLLHKAGVIKENNPVFFCAFSLPLLTWATDFPALPWQLPQSSLKALSKSYLSGIFFPIQQLYPGTALWKIWPSYLSVTIKLGGNRHLLVERSMMSDHMLKVENKIVCRLLPLGLRISEDQFNWVLALFILIYCRI